MLYIAFCLSSNDRRLSPLASVHMEGDVMLETSVSEQRRRRRVALEVSNGGIGGEFAGRSGGPSKVSLSACWESVWSTMFSRRAESSS